MSNHAPSPQFTVSNVIEPVLAVSLNLFNSANATAALSLVAKNEYTASVKLGPSIRTGAAFETYGRLLALSVWSV